MEENLELKDREYPLEDPAREEDQETSFSELEDERLTDFFWDAPDAPTHEPTKVHPRLAAQKEELKKVEKNAALREYFKESLGISTNSTAGKYSKELFDNSELILNKRSGKITGLEYKGKRIIVNKNQYTKHKRLTLDIGNFVDILQNASEEYEKTASSVIEKEIQLSPSGTRVKNVIENTALELKERINNLESVVENTPNLKEFLSPEEIRESSSTVRESIFSQNISSNDKINLLGIEKEHWKKKKSEATSESRKVYFESLEKITEYQIDKFFIENDQKPKSEEGKELLREEARNNDLTRFEKFKRWAKENLLGASAIAIAIGGIITTVLMAGRSALKQGASAFSKFANAVAKIAAKAGPLLSSLFGIIATALKWGAKGIMFPSNNLWILAVATAYAIIETRRKRKREAWRSQAK